MRSKLLLALLIAVPFAAPAAPAFHDFKSVAIAPDGRHVAAIETSDDGSDKDAPASLLIFDLAGGSESVALPCPPGPNCKVESPTWSMRGELAFLVLRPHDGVAQIDAVQVKSGGAVRQVLSFKGTLDRLRYGPRDQLAVLATAQAHKLVGRTQAGAPLVGDIGSETDEQRIALIDGGAFKFVSPANLYVYEFDFLPGGGFVGTAAPGDGDSQWWVAKLYAFEQPQARVLFAPGPREQLAMPSVSPDGKSVAFIGGWMSDFGSTGGDAYLLALDQPGATPNNLTAGSHATVTALDWSCGRGLTGMMLAGDTVTIARLDAAGAKPVWSGQESISRGLESGLSCGPQGVAAISSSFGTPPEIVAGRLGHWRPISRENAALGTAAFNVHSVVWRNEGFEVQGWLLQPAGGDASSKRPMVVLVHGGPQGASTNKFLPPLSQARALLEAGWDVFEPNYRGSFGQGEAFASASIRDLGGGDWRDLLTGIDAAERAAPIDESRLGIMGASYGGYMTMWSITQTHRFRAAVAHAGVSDWLSIEGEAPQPGSDPVSFGGSVYDDPAPYLKASPIMHMRGVNTPTLITVGERDLECPMPQSQEFYTALDALGVPVEFHVYAGEGHHLEKAADRADLRNRTVAWFQRWFAAPPTAAK